MLRKYAGPPWSGFWLSNLINLLLVVGSFFGAAKLGIDPFPR
jgi:hypothetical protein